MKEQKTGIRAEISKRRSGKIISLILSLALIFTVAAIPAVAEDSGVLTSGDYQYKVLEDNTVEIEGYVGDRNTLVELSVPEMIDGKTVTSIGFNAFSSCEKLESVTLPEGFARIGWRAFYNCASLNSVTIPEGVTYIGEHAFTGCESLMELTVPKSVTTIFDYAFGYYVSSWINMEYSKMDGFKVLGYTNTAAQSYAEKNGFEFVEVGEVPLFEYKENDDETIEITGYNGDDDELVIPGAIDGKTVTSIGDGAFMSCKSLTKVTMADSITTIGTQSFGFCTNLTSVTLSEGLIKIGYSAFNDCTSLKEITVPKSVETINDYALGRCNTHMDENGEYVRDKVEGFKISGYTNSAAERYAKENGFEFVSVGEFPLFEYTENDDGTIEITGYNGSDAELTIPDEIDGKKVESIGEWAFEDCDTIEELSFNEGIGSIGNYAFFSCDGIVNVTLPESVTTIGIQAFAYCKSLESVTLSEGVTKIGYSAFSDCTSLKEVTIPKNVTEIEDHAFGKFNTHMDESGQYVYDKVEGFKIKGYTGTAAEKYAADNGFEFIALDVETKKLGDINGDGELDLLDSTILERHLAQFNGYETIDESVADVNQDGEVNLFDSTILERHLAKMNGYESLPFVS